MPSITADIPASLKIALDAEIARIQGSTTSVITAALAQYLGTPIHTMHGIPEWKELRSLASAIQEHTLTRLDHYLEQFEANARSNGITVHWACDAAEHNRIIHGILKDHRAKSLVNSKSMLAEECGFRAYVTSVGIEVIETDLGERIEQREATRQLLLAADAGLTGCNFAVAETGTFVVCANEGDAGLCANVPKLHIASIGIEKIIPRLEHLGIFVRLLSWSALGSPITQCTSHFRGPRAGGEMHVVLVDNGRSSNRLSTPGNTSTYGAP
jgi:L-lactate dehydrogenase complex protein LldF